MDLRCSLKAQRLALNSIIGVTVASKIHEKMARGNPPLDLVLANNKLSAVLVLSKLLLMDSSISRNSFSHKPKYYNHGQSSGLCLPGGNKKMNRAFSWVCMKCTVFSS